MTGMYGQSVQKTVNQFYLPTVMSNSIFNPIPVHSFHILFPLFCQQKHSLHILCSYLINHSTFYLDFFQPYETKPHTHLISFPIPPKALLKYTLLRFLNSSSRSCNTRVNSLTPLFLRVIYQSNTRIIIIIRNINTIINIIIIIITILWHKED